jgi:ABC-type molybdate transport system substrate-binding protein
VKANRFRLSTILATTLAVTLGFIFLFARKAPAQGAELRVLTSDGMKPAVEELAPQVEHSIGRKLATEFDASKTLRDKVQSGVPFDVAILTSDVIDDLVKQGKIAAGTSTEVAPHRNGGWYSRRFSQARYQHARSAETNAGKSEVHHLQSKRRERSAYQRDVCASGNRRCRKVQTHP